ncbi:MAG: TlpA disulfide reductase family protein [Thiohalobacterales bacterium]|nr:TlpA disulfide reductase family protein [Thiohalobacterales bacterium]
MKIRGLILAFGAVALLAIFGYLLLTPVGLRHSPDISLATISGQRLQLSSYRGRPLLVTFWATSCPGCLKEMPHLIELYHELHPRGLEIIAIAMAHDPPDRVLAMSKARRIPYPVALDIDSTAAQAFGDVRMTPTSFLIAPDGRVVFQTTGQMNLARLRRDIIGLLTPAQTAIPAGSTRIPEASIDHDLG